MTTKSERNGKKRVEQAVFFLLDSFSNLMCPVEIGGIFSSIAFYSVKFNYIIIYERILVEYISNFQIVYVVAFNTNLWHSELFILHPVAIGCHSYFDLILSGSIFEYRFTNPMNENETRD